MTGFVVVIPARYESSRLPGKPLADIGGQPMIARVHARAVASGARDVLVATDDERIADACRRFGARAEMTSPEHASGTDRIAELAAHLGWPAETIVVNVQGDEPLLPPALIAQVAALIERRADAAIATLMTPLGAGETAADPNLAKVVVNRAGDAMYFSRAPIPHRRDADGAAGSLRRHIGLYAYRVGELKRLAATPPCELERIERLEQLRALWLGMRIAIEDAVEAPPRGVDTPEDLEAVRRIVAGAS